MCLCRLNHRLSQEWQAAMKCYTKVLDREPGLTNAALERKKLQSKMASLWGFSAFVGYQTMNLHVRLNLEIPSCRDLPFRSFSF